MISRCAPRFELRVCALAQFMCGSFVEMLDPTFCNVIEKLDKENGDIYIGELRWEIAVERSNRRRRRSLIADLMSGSSEKKIYKST